MDSAVISETMIRPAFKDEKNDNLDCSMPQKEQEEVTVKTEVENDGEECSEIAVQSTDITEQSSLFESNPPIAEIFLKREQLMDNEYEFQCVGGPSTSTEMVSVKIEKIEDNDDGDNSIGEEKMDFPIATDDSAFEEDPLKLKSDALEGVMKEEQQNNFEEHNLTKTEKSNDENVVDKLESEDELKLKCSFCFSKFADYFKLLNHLQLHTGEKPFQCVKCQIYFSWRNDLVDHLKTHTKHKAFVCEYCQKSYYHRALLKSHLKKHTTKYTCEFCQESFWLVKDLKAHLRTHTEENINRCKYCSKSFSYRSHLKIHLRSHTGEKPFVCEYCQKSFSKKFQLKKHLLIHKGD